MFPAHCGAALEFRQILAAESAGMSAPPEENEKDRWRSVFEIYEATAQLGPDERSAFLKSIHCDAETSQAVFNLLTELEAEVKAEADSAWTPPHKAGRYVVLAELGRGALGRVYGAQDSEL